MSTCFQISCQKLIKPLQKLVAVAEQKNQVMPILSHVHLEIKQNRLTLTTTDQQNALQVNLEMDISEPVELKTTVSADKLYRFCRTLTKEEVLDFNFLDEKVVIKTQHAEGQFELATLPAEDFPLLKKVDASLRFKCVATPFLKAIKQVKYALAPNNYRVYLTGIHLFIAPSKVTFIGCDSHRLALTDLSSEHYSYAEEIETKLILPLKACNEFLQLFEGIEEQIEFEVQPNRMIEARAGELVYQCLLLDSQSPDLRRIIPQQDGFVATLNKTTLSDACNRMMIISSDNSEQGRRIELHLNETTVNLQARSKSNDYFSEKLPIQHNGEAIVIAMNLDYLIQTMQHLEGDEISLWYKQSDQSCLFSATLDQHHLALIMPFSQ